MLSPYLFAGGFILTSPYGHPNDDVCRVYSVTGEVTRPPPATTVFHYLTRAGSGSSLAVACLLLAALAFALAAACAGANDAITASRLNDAAF
jgi:hypothetical protein